MVGGVARVGTKWRVGLIGWGTGTGAAEGEADLGLKSTRAPSHTPGCPWHLWTRAAPGSNIV